MFKNLMNGVSLSSLMLRAPDDESGAAAKTALRAQLAKGNTTPEADAVVPDPKEEEGDDDGDDEEEDEDEEGEAADGEVDPPEEETEEAKKAREAKEKIEAKAKRKDDRMQRRIDEATAARKTAEAEIARLKAQLEADPDKKLTAEEVESRAEAIAAKKVADKEIEDINSEFQKTCDDLQNAAIKLDKDFNAKVNEIAADFGPIPSFMIATLADMDNGAEVLAYFADNDEFAESIYGKSPAKMTKLLVEKSIELENANKKPKKQISKVPDPGTPVKGSRVVSNTLTEADTKNMDNYVAKRMRMREEERKRKGFH